LTIWEWRTEANTVVFAKQCAFKLSTNKEQQIMKSTWMMVMVLSVGLSAQNGLFDLTPQIDSDVATAQIRGGGEYCNVDIYSDGSINTSCRTMINSRGKRIYCTKHKRICKTLDEVRAFLFDNPTSTYQSCFDHASSTHAMRRCNAQELAYQDGRLNTYYHDAMRRLSKSEQDTLRQAQRAWITYRDKKCEAAGREMRGGTGEYLLIEGCLIDETRKRAEELREIR
jgi:uncharacterized protein YecT (DUF1311 family)